VVAAAAARISLVTLPEEEELADYVTRLVIA
jgi:hypothetical protein